MKFALVEGRRHEAQPHLSGRCEFCEHAVIAKCGPVRIWHWSHLGARICDHWWERETPWHRTWKDRFPREWQEIIQWSENGEKHIADVKTERGEVLEFQHSHLVRKEREAREAFYQNPVWVVDGLRRVRDKKAFFASLKERSILKTKPLTFSVSPDGCALLRDWVDTGSPVFFDFGDDPVLVNFGCSFMPFSTPILWRLARGPDGKAHILPVTKTSFLNHYLKGLPFKYLDYSAALARAQQASRVRPPIDFERYMARGRRRLPRF
jgi:competence protein CoiA